MEIEEDIITYGVSKIYDHYGLDIDSYKEFKFENEEWPCFFISYLVLYFTGGLNDI